MVQVSAMLCRCDNASHRIVCSHCYSSPSPRYRPKHPCRARCCHAHCCRASCERHLTVQRPRVRVLVHAIQPEKGHVWERVEAAVIGKVSAVIAAAVVLRDSVSESREILRSVPHCHRLSWLMLSVQQLKHSGTRSEARVHSCIPSEMQSVAAGMRASEGLWMKRRRSERID